MAVLITLVPPQVTILDAGVGTVTLERRLGGTHGASEALVARGVAASPGVAVVQLEEHAGALARLIGGLEGVRAMHDGAVARLAEGGRALTVLSDGAGGAELKIGGSGVEGFSLSLTGDGLHGLIADLRALQDWPTAIATG